MSTLTATQEMLAIEKNFWDAMQKKDGRRAREMTDEGCIVVGAQGVSAIDGKTMGKLTEEGDWDLENYSFDESNAQVRMITPDIAIVAYSVNEKVTVDGRSLPVEANDASVWVRRDGEWLCALHTESLAGDPFGRDREA
jgi:hypothetical protein